MMEILAPAGSPESLQAAVRAGADAVYLGGGSFSARAFAHNFDDNALREAVRYCHARGVRVHLAVNTLLRDEEIERAVEFVRFACTLPVDAVLVQDTGLLLRLRECAPALPLHASTQMSLHTPQGAAAAGEAGMTRAVLSREMTAAELRETRGAVSIELESFVHGALCMSVSGQCYFSAMLGSRSGNRGMCAQTCRLPFSAPGGTGHDLSLRDLSMITRMEELRRAGVCSAKIEGRMKRPEYVAAATAACRQSADGLPPDPMLLSDLESVFSRSGFTSGYPDGRLGVEMFGTRTKEDVTGATSAVFARLHGLYREERSRIPVSLFLTIQAGEPVSLTVQDEEGHCAHAVSDVIPEPAVNRPLDRERCLAQLQKTGGTPFFCKTAGCSLGEGLSVPVSLLNRLRRQALEELLAQRSRKTPPAFSMPSLEETPHLPKGEPAIRAFFTGAEQVCPEAKACELIWLPLHTSTTQLLRLRELGVTQALAGGWGMLPLARELGFTLRGDYGLNIFNSRSLQVLTDIGFVSACLSFELRHQQIRDLRGALPREAIVYGRLPLMVTENCLIRNALGCKPRDLTGPCRQVHRLTDRRGEEFPVLSVFGCRSEIENGATLYLGDKPEYRRCGLTYARLRFTTESPAECVRVLEAYRSGGGTPPQGHTRGLFYRGVD